jgi:tetratricopeptide (TPR) repeat protein
MMAVSFYGDQNIMHRSSWLVTAALVGINVALVQQVATAKSAEEVGSIATAITVEIKTENPEHKGSGILLQRQQDVYTVLTVKHVVQNCQGFLVKDCGKDTIKDYTNLTIKTSDGITHKFLPGSIRKSGNNLDLAILKFRSSKNYSLVNIGTSKTLQPGSTVYVAGFPSVDETLISAGLLSFTDGKVIGVTSRINDSGYSLVYGNNTLSGMSGGPVLNQNGELVAIHGQGERYEQQKTGRNLGIVVERFGAVALAMGIQLDQPVATPAPSVVANATDYYLAGVDKVYDEEYQGALTDLNQAISLDPQYVSAYAFRGVTRIRLNDIAGATTDLNKAITLDPKSALAYTMRGALRSNLKDFEGALADANRAISLDPKFSLAYYLRSNIVFGENPEKSQTNTKRRELVLADLNRSIALDPNFAEAYVIRATFFSDQAASIRDLQRAAKLLRQQKRFRALSSVIKQLLNKGVAEME